jgi:streptomycin 6-kinase
LQRQLDIVAAASGVERRRLLRRIVAYAGLSAAWLLGDGEAADSALEIAEQAAAALGLR